MLSVSFAFLKLFDLLNHNCVVDPKVYKCFIFLYTYIYDKKMIRFVNMIYCAKEGISNGTDW
ncbi:MAG: hypothetical protein K0R00_2862 [Herbinix sp.]|jgi:hypothetical protein|nr:hypothetical protein [Herbinix sp.]